MWSVKCCIMMKGVSIFFRVAVVGAFFSYVLVKRLLTRNQIGYRA
jgi:hypothetical protein